MSFSDYLENALLDHLFGKATFSAPANIFIALFTVAPADDGTGGTEVSGGAYARVSTAAADWNAAAAGLIDNLNAIVFPQATANWGTVVAFGLYDALTAGNYLGGNNLTTSKAIDTDDTAEFAAGVLDVSLD